MQRFLPEWYKELTARVFLAFTLYVVGYVVVAVVKELIGRKGSEESSEVVKE